MNNLAFQIYGSTKSGIFQSTWDTTNISTGSSASNQITLPLISTGTYNFWVDWGDGSTTNVTSYSQRTHTYASAGTYTVRATGIVGIWRFGNGGDKLKILTISSWGKLILGSNTFNGCSNVTMSGITDVPDLTGVTSLNSTFAYCSLITTIGRLNEWNTSSVTSLTSTFYSCSNFNQNIGAWNVSNCLNFDGMFQSTSNFNNGGSSTIDNWRFKTSGNISMYAMFNSSRFNQPLNNWNTTRVTNMANMFLNNIFFNQNIGAWDVSNWTTSGSMFYGATAFNNGGSPDINNWTLNTNPTVSLNFYQMFLGANSFNQPIYNWNTVRVTGMGGMFYFNRVFNNGLASGIPGTMNWNTSNVTNMSQMFYYDDAFNCNIGSWDVSNVTNFGDMFLGASQTFNNGGSSDINNWRFKTTGTVTMDGMMRSGSFNQPVGSWNMERVTSAAFMFAGANSFNQNVDTWNLATCTNAQCMFQGASFNNGYASGLGNTLNMQLNITTAFTAAYMFYSSTSFNCNINNLDFTKCTDMSGMFYGATKYNNGLTPGTPGVLTINTSNVTLMASMFFGANSFNQDVGLFNVSKVTNFSSMLFNSIVFNNGDNINPINNWILNTTTGANIDMTQMFGGNQGTKVFNRALNNWNTSEVTNMSGMFLNSGGTHSFNQPIDNWNVSKVTTMYQMFLGNNTFNQSLSNWERTGSTLTNVIDMSFMFQNATAFNQTIGSWNVSQVTSFTNFMGSKAPSTYSSANLDAIYNGWIVNGVKPNLSISFGTAKYTQAGKPGKDTLTSPVISGGYNWTITDGLLTVSGTSNNGGLIRVTTTAAHGFITGNSVYIYGVNGTTNANGTWTVTVVNTTVIELQGSTYNAAWTSGGNVILG